MTHTASRNVSPCPKVDGNANYGNKMTPLALVFLSRPPRATDVNHGGVDAMRCSGIDGRRTRARGRTSICPSARARSLPRGFRSLEIFASFHSGSWVAVAREREGIEGERRIALRRGVRLSFIFFRLAEQSSARARLESNLFPS